MKNERNVSTEGHDRSLIEAGVYRLIFTDQKPAPEQLMRSPARRWVSALRIPRRHRPSYKDDDD